MQGLKYSFKYILKRKIYKFRIYNPEFVNIFLEESRLYKNYIYNLNNTVKFLKILIVLYCYVFPYYIILILQG